MNFLLCFPCFFMSGMGIQRSALPFVMQSSCVSDRCLMSSLPVYPYTLALCVNCPVTIYLAAADILLFHLFGVISSGASDHSGWAACAFSLILGFPFTAILRLSELDLSWIPYPLLLSLFPYGQGAHPSVLSEKGWVMSRHCVSARVIIMFS